MKFVPVLIVGLLLNLPALGADLQPYLKSAPMPFYPALALQARVMRKVSLHFTINEQGETSDIEASTGPKLLQDAAVENVHNWMFHPPSCACRVKREAVLVYSLSAELRSAPETPTVMVKWFLEAPVIRVEIEEAGGILINTQSSH
jgi:TonB family protein